jgi:hypothetical protein
MGLWALLLILQLGSMNAMDSEAVVPSEVASPQRTYSRICSAADRVKSAGSLWDGSCRLLGESSLESAVAALNAVDARNRHARILAKRASKRRTKQSSDWSEYKIVTDEFKPCGKYGYAKAKGKAGRRRKAIRRKRGCFRRCCRGVMGHFDTRNMHRWNDSNKLAFNKDPWWWVKSNPNSPYYKDFKGSSRAKRGRLGETWRTRKLRRRLKRPRKLRLRRRWRKLRRIVYKRSSDCVKDYKKACKTFGTCKMRLEGNKRDWKTRFGCPFNSHGLSTSKIAPCGGTFKRAIHWHWKKIKRFKKKKGLFNRSVTKTARYATQSQIDEDPKRAHLLDSGPKFYTISNEGIGFDGKSRCRMNFGVRMGRCKGCCCSGGLVKYEVRTADQSKNGGDTQGSCADWYVSAVTGASNFFSMWRLIVSSHIARRCRSVACPKRRLQGRAPRTEP